MKMNVLKFNLSSFRGLLYLSIFSLIIVVACVSLDEEADGLLTQESFFQTQEDVNAALAAMYRSVNHSFHTNNSFFALHVSDDMASSMSVAFDKLTPDPNNDDLNRRRWGDMYAGIYNANSIIANFDRADASGEFKAQAHAQARFWRGFLHLFLTNTFGTIPLLTTPDATGEEPLSSFEEIYDLIIEDFQFATDNLPESWDSSNMARPSKWAAQSFLSLTYLYGSGFPLNNGSYAQQALANAKAVKDGSGHSLLVNYSELWQGSASDFNNESIFEYQFTDTNQNWGGSGGGTGNYLIGRSSTPAEMDDFGGGWNEIYSEITFFNEFPDGPRKEATFLTEFLRKGQLVTWQQSIEAHPFYLKYGNPANYKDFDTNMMLMRYAEVLLIHAEAQALIDGGTTASADALDSYNQVRVRAGLPIATSITQEEIVNERAWELAAEFRRYFDIVRTQTLDEVVAKRDPSEPSTAGRTLTEVFPWLPIPASEVQLNPKLQK